MQRPTTPRDVLEERIAICVEAVCELIDVIGRPLTHSEIGALLGITRQRVQQIEAQATQRIRSSRLARQLAALVAERDGVRWDAWRS